MGCFDTVWIPCPRCGHRNEFQSKAGSCSLYDFDLAEAPIELQADVHGEVTDCSACSAQFKVVVQSIATTVLVGPGETDDELAEEYADDGIDWPDGPHVGGRGSSSDQIRVTWDCRCGETGIDFEEHPNVCPACGKDVRTDWPDKDLDFQREVIRTLGRHRLGDDRPDPRENPHGAFNQEEGD